MTRKQLIPALLLLVIAGGFSRHAKAAEMIFIDVASEARERSAWNDQVEKSRRAYLRFIARAVDELKLNPIRLATVEKTSGDWTREPDLDDPTLEPGDVVVTQRGLLVFRGRSLNAKHEFAPVGSAEFARLFKRRELLAIQKANASASLK